MSGDWAAPWGAEGAGWVLAPSLSDPFRVGMCQLGVSAPCHHEHPGESEPEEVNSLCPGAAGGAWAQLLRDESLYLRLIFPPYNGDNKVSSPGVSPRGDARREKAVPPGCGAGGGGGGVGKRRLGGGWGCSVSPGTYCWGCEHCLFAANLSLPFMLLCVFCFFSFSPFPSQGPGDNHWSYEGKYPAVFLLSPTTQRTLGSSQPWLMITGLLCALSGSPFPPA